MNRLVVLIALLLSGVSYSQSPGDCPATATQITECGIVYTGNNGSFTDNCGGDMCGCVGGNSNPSNFDNDCNTTYPGGNCGSDFSGSIENSMFWRFTPTENCSYEISITPSNCCCAQGNGPDFMQVWIGQISGGSVTSYLVNDNSNTNLTGGITTTYTVPLSITQGDVLIMLDGNAGAECDLDVVIQPSSDCGDLCPIILNNSITSWTGSISGGVASLVLGVEGNGESRWALEWSRDGISWILAEEKSIEGSGKIQWQHSSPGMTYYRANGGETVSETIALWNSTMLPKVVKSRWTPGGKKIKNIGSYRGVYIEVYTDGTRELLVR